MRSIGLERTEMYGGYILGTSLEPTRELSRPRRAAERRLAAVVGHRQGDDRASTSPSSIAAVWLASAGLGPLGQVRAPGSTPREARYLLYLLAHVQPTQQARPRGARSAGSRSCCTRQAGSTPRATTPGLVVWRGGVFVAAVMTYRAPGRSARRTCSPAGSRPRRCAASAAERIAQGGARAPLRRPRCEPACALGVRCRPIRVDPWEAVGIAESPLRYSSGAVRGLCERSVRVRSGSARPDDATSYSFCTN